MRHGREAEVAPLRQHRGVQVRLEVGRAWLAATSMFEMLREVDPAINFKHQIRQIDAWQPLVDHLPELIDTGR